MFLVLCWTIAAPHALRAALDAASSRRLPPAGRLGALGAGLVCTAAALLVQFPGVLGLLALLAWAAADLAVAAWAALRTRPELLQQLAPVQPGLAQALQQAVDAESQVDPASLALLRHALPALPALVLGLLLQEGGELVSSTGGAASCKPACTLQPCRPLPRPCSRPTPSRCLPQVGHELSVPAVTAILLSVLAMTVATAADQLMSGGLTRVAHEALVAAGPLGTGASRPRNAMCFETCPAPCFCWVRWRYLPGRLPWLSHCPPRALPAVVTEAAVHGLSSPVACVAALACALAGVLLRVTAAGAS